MLCEGHCAGVKPAVDNLRHTLHGLAALGTGDGHLVDIRTMELNLCRVHIAALLSQLRTAADALEVSALALPDVQWSTPVAVTGDRPVLNILQPVAETALADGLGNPVYCIVIADQVIADSSLADARTWARRRAFLQRPGL